MATHVYIDSDNFPSAKGYFLASDKEKTKSGTLPLRSDRILAISKLTLYRILKDIATQDSIFKEGDSLIIVCHGSVSGLSLNLAKWAKVQGKKVKADDRVMNVLGTNRENSKVAQIIGATEHETGALRGIMDMVQARKLHRVEIRGCRVGQSNETLNSIRNFFGAGIVGAPIARNAYAPISSFDTSASQQSVESLQRSGQVFAVSGGSVGFEVQPTSGVNFQVRRRRATSQAALKSWQNAKFFFRSPKLKNFHIHGHFHTSGGKNTLVFPKDSQYVSNLSEFCGFDGDGVTQRPKACHAA